MLRERVTGVVRPGWQRTGVDHGAVLGRLGVGTVHHGYHGNAEVHTETVDHGEPREHQEGQVEASRAALGGDCAQGKQGGSRHGGTHPRVPLLEHVP